MTLFNDRLGGQQPQPAAGVIEPGAGALDGARQDRLHPLAGPRHPLAAGEKVAGDEFRRGARGLRARVGSKIAQREIELS